jgi:hypothetical protein
MRLKGDSEIAIDGIDGRGMGRMRDYISERSDFGLQSKQFVRFTIKAIC